MKCSNESAQLRRVGILLCCLLWTCAIHLLHPPALLFVDMDAAALLVHFGALATHRVHFSNYVLIYVGAYNKEIYEHAL